MKAMYLCLFFGANLEGQTASVFIEHQEHDAPMGDYGWSMDSGTSQGSVAVEYGRVLEYPKKRNKISDHEKARSLQINRVRIGK